MTIQTGSVARVALILIVLVCMFGCGNEAAAPEQPIAANWCDRLPRPGYAALERVESADDWFEVYRVAPGVFAIYEPFQWQEVISYLILGSERALLFDTGLGISSISGVVSELTTLPVTVLNSHTHFDHIGSNAVFSQVLAMNTDFTRQRAQGIAHEVVREEVSPDALCRPLPEGVDAETFHIAPFEITEFIEDGHRIDLGDRTLDVLSIPGHTPDAVALLDAEAGFLWTGDSFYEGPIWLFVEETDLEAYGRSVERLAALAPQLTTVFPAHNTPVAQPERLVELRDAFAQVQAGTVEGEDRGNGRVVYDFGAFSLLMRSGN